MRKSKSLTTLTLAENRKSLVQWFLFIPACINTYITYQRIMHPFQNPDVILDFLTLWEVNSGLKYFGSGIWKSTLVSLSFLCLVHVSELNFPDHNNDNLFQASVRYKHLSSPGCSRPPCNFGVYHVRRHQGWWQHLLLLDCPIHTVTVSWCCRERNHRKRKEHVGKSAEWIYCLFFQQILSTCRYQGMS